MGGYETINLHIRIGDVHWYAFAFDIGTEIVLELVSTDQYGDNQSIESFASREDLLRRAAELAPIEKWKTKEQREQEAMQIYRTVIKLSLGDQD